MPCALLCADIWPLLCGLELLMPYPLLEISKISNTPKIAPWIMRAWRIYSLFSISVLPYLIPYVSRLSSYISIKANVMLNLERYHQEQYRNGAISSEKLWSRAVSSGAVLSWVVPFVIMSFGVIPCGVVPFGVVPFWAVPFGVIPFGVEWYHSMWCHLK